MNLLTKKWLVVWGLILFGVIFTFWDYRNYRKIEMANYGHGPGDKLVSWKIDKLFQNLEFRIKYPDELTIIQESKYPVIFQNNDVLVKIELREGASGSLVNWENKEIASLAKNEQMYGERSYENTERINMTVIKFQRFVGDKTYMVSRYLAKKNDRLFVLEFVVELDSWQAMEGNIREMARTLVLL